MRKWLTFFIGLLGLDVVTKICALHWIPFIRLADRKYPFGGIGVFSQSGITCSLNTTVNTGAAWGIFADHSGMLFALRAAIIVFLVAYLLFSNKGGISKIPLWLVVTGAVGNAIDYCVYGYVIDFIHFTFWDYSFPIFNVADSCITLGVLSLFLFPDRSKKQMQIS